MDEKTLTLEAVKEQFCTADKREALKQMADRLESVWDIDKAAELTVKIGEKMEKEIEAGGQTWTPGERMMWTIMQHYYFVPSDTRHLLQTEDAAKIDAEIAERLEQLKNK